MLHALESEGFIRSWQDVLQRSFHKYNQRVNGIENGFNNKKAEGSRARIKAKQKKDRQEEHEAVFGKKDSF